MGFEGGFDLPKAKSQTGTGKTLVFSGRSRIAPINHHPGTHLGLTSKLPSSIDFDQTFATGPVRAVEEVLRSGPSNCPKCGKHREAALHLAAMSIQCELNPRRCPT